MRSWRFIVKFKPMNEGNDNKTYTDRKAVIQAMTHTQCYMKCPHESEKQRTDVAIKTEISLVAGAFHYNTKIDEHLQDIYGRHF